MTDISIENLHALVHGPNPEVTDLRETLRLQEQRVLDLIKEKTATEVQVKSLEEQLKVSRSNTNQMHEKYVTAVRHHCEDIETISEMMVEAAQENDLCNVFDETVEAINEKLHKELTPRAREYELTYTVTVTVTTNPNDLGSLESEIRRELEYATDWTVDATHESTDESD